MIYSLKITDKETGIAPIYEVHSWEKAQEIIDATKKLNKNGFTFEVIGFVSPEQDN